MVSVLLKILNAEPDNYSTKAHEILKSIGEVFERNLLRGDLINSISDYDVLITRLKHTVDAKIIENGRKLKAIVSATTGLDHIDSKYAEDKGYIDKDLIAPPNVDWSTLDMPNFSKEEIFGLQRTFVMYVKFPKSRWKEIHKARKLTPKGDAIWEQLRKEFSDKYFSEAKYEIHNVND